MKVILKVGGGIVLLVVLAQCVNDNLVDLTPKATAAKDTTSTGSTNTGSTSSTSTGATNTTTTTTTSTSTSTSTGTTTTTSVVSFSKSIQPILAKYSCAGCHGSGYYNYSGVKSLAVSGKLYGVMSGASGYKLMPPGQGATAAELTLIKEWITAGEPNN